MTNNKLPIEEGFIQKIAYSQEDNAFNATIQKMVKPPLNVDAMVFATHFLAANGIRALKTINIKVPEEVALVSMGQVSDFDLIEPPVSSLILPSDKIGDKAVEILLHNINDKQ